MPPVNIESNDLYERLGVSPDATADQIRKAFQRLSRIHHPDKNPNDAQSATRRFQKIQEAYYVLSDTVRKRDYDQRRCGFSNRGHSASASGCNEERTFYFEGGSFTYSGPGSFTFSGPGTWSFTNGGNAFNFNCFDNDDGDWDSSDSDDYDDDYYDEGYDEGPEPRPSNRVLGFKPPPVHKSEARLPRSWRTTLAQLRSDFCKRLNSFLNRIRKSPTNICRHCNAHPDTTTHLFSCSSHSFSHRSVAPPLRRGTLPLRFSHLRSPAPPRPSTPSSSGRTSPVFWNCARRWQQQQQHEGPDQGYDRVIANGVQNGNIHCSGNISMKKGVVNGNLKTPKSVIITGGVINGNVIADKCYYPTTKD